MKWKKLIYGGLALMFLGLLLMAAEALAAPIATEELEVHSVRVEPIPWWQSFFGDFLAIGFNCDGAVCEGPVFEPGETVELTIQEACPANAAYTILSFNSDGKNFYYANIGHLFPPNTCVLVKITVTMPEREDEYSADLVFFDGNGDILYEDHARFTISSSDPTCPASYCDSWKQVDDRFVQNGRLEQKSCYVVNPSTCQQTIDVEYRTLCNSGYHLEDGRCLADSGEPECGNGVQEAGEECDAGRSNGFCPTTCSKSCTRVACEDIPVVHNNDSAGKPALAGLGLAGALVLIGLVVFVLGALMYSKGG